MLPMVGGMQEETKLMTKTITVPADEPIGIIISRGAQDEPAPRVASYEWAPVPDEPVSDTSRAA